MARIPTVAQIVALPDPVSGNVTGDFTDSNGDMNVLHYLDFASLGADAIVQRIGINDSYRSQRRLGVFTAEHHLRYYSELREGDSFAVHGQFLERSTTVVHLMTFVVDQRRSKLACTLEITLIHVSLDSRRPVEIPSDISAALDRGISDSSNAGWAAPICGAMGLRR
jgi:acyl-CoA thioester hydrolase